MRYTLGALAACAAVALAAPAAAQTTPAATRLIAHIDVAGQGSVDRVPDQAIVAFSAGANDDDPTRATSAANATYNALFTRLRALGLDASAIRTTSYAFRFHPRPPQPSPDSSGPYGFVVSREVLVTSNTVDQVGPIIDAGVAAGAKSVDSVGFVIRDYRAAYRAALGAAMTDADAQARTLASAAHFRIVRIVSIGTTQATTRPFTSFTLYSIAPKSIPTDVQPSDLTVSATVNVTYEVAPLP